MMNLDLQKVLPAEAFETEQNEGDYIGKGRTALLRSLQNQKADQVARIGFYRRQGDDRSMYLQVQG